MSITKFGEAIRNARQEVGHTLRSMAKEMGVPASTLSAAETGRIKIQEDLIHKIYNFYTQIGYESPVDLYRLVEESRDNPLFKGASLEKRQFMVSFANSELTREEVREFIEHLEKLKRGANNAS